MVGTNSKLIVVLRWLCVLPAALLGDFAVQVVVGALVQASRYGGGGNLSDSSIAYFWSVFLYYVPRKSAFVIAGTKTAPRHQTAAAIVLAVLGILGSLMTHVIGQYLAGNHVGSVNYTHAIAESAGLLGGAACVLWQARRNRRADKATSSGVPTTHGEIGDP